MNNYCPELIREWIDNDVLPDYANGYNTAIDITDVVLEEAIERLDLETSDINFYEKNIYDPLIDSWLVTGNHKKEVVDYIQSVFDSWEKEGETE